MPKVQLSLKNMLSASLNAATMYIPILTLLTTMTKRHSKCLAINGVMCSNNGGAVGAYRVISFIQTRSLLYLIISCSRGPFEC